MRNFEDLNEQEILALTDTDVDRYVRLRMAEEGIRILKAPIEPKYTKLPSPTVPAYHINGLTYPLTHKDAAERLSAAIKKDAAHFTYTDYDYRASDIKYLNPMGSTEGMGSVDERKYYTQSQAAELQEIARKNKELEDTYKKELLEYRINQEKVTEIRKEVENKVEGVRSKYRNFENLLEHFREYLNLAEGSEEIAWKFLRKAYAVGEEAANYIQEKLTTTTEK